MAAVKKYGAEASVAETTNRWTPTSTPDRRPRSSGSLEAKTAIEEKLKTEPGLESKDIQVTLTQKSVKLSGSVPSPDDRDKAVRIAKLYAGDREVEDQLTIQER